MQYKIFVIPIKNIEDAQEEFNKFLRSHRVLAVQKEFVCSAENSYWTFVIEYLQTPTSTTESDGKSKVDYKEVLSEQDFTIFSRLREARKQIANSEAIPVYAIFTNEQLATIARNKPKTSADMSKIEGIGEAKIKKYSERFLAVINGVQPGGETKVN